MDARLKRTLDVADYQDLKHQRACDRLFQYQSNDGGILLLENPGNQCFANTVITSLVSCTNFMEFIKQVHQISPNELCQELARLCLSVQVATVEKPKSDSLTELKKYIKNSSAITWKDNTGQQDAVEFFDYVMDTLGMFIKILLFLSLFIINFFY